MYKYNTITGSISLNGEIIIMDDSSQAYQEYKVWLESGGTLEFIEEIPHDEIERKIQELRNEFSLKISRIKGMREALERFAIDGEAIPKEIVDQRATFIEEYEQEKQKIINDGM